MCGLNSIVFGFMVSSEELHMDLSILWTEKVSMKKFWEKYFLSILLKLIFLYTKNNSLRLLSQATRWVGWCLICNLSCFYVIKHDLITWGCVAVTNESSRTEVSADPTIERSESDTIVDGMDFGELCNEFECISSPLVESTARQLLRDIIELREGNRALGTYAVSVKYKVLVWLFFFPEFTA